MCSNSIDVNCPICGVLFDDGLKRFIVESCGHKKCRNCIIKDENGCSLCLKILAKEHADIGSEHIVEENSPNINENDSENYKNKYHSHIPTSQLNNSLIDSNSPAAVSDTLQIYTDIFNSLNTHSISVALAQDTDIVTKNCNYIKDDNKIAMTANVIASSINLQKIKEPIKINNTKILIPKKKARKSYNSFYNNVKHIQMATINKKPIYECTKCNKKFTTQSNRKYHIYCDETIDKPLKCDTCGKTFVTKNHLSYHMKTHLDNKPYECKICKLTYLRKSSLQKHMKSHAIHPNEYKYKCNECGEKYLYKELFLAHLNRHKNVLPFKCDKCNREFLYKSNFTKHLLTHIEDNKIVQCMQCPKKFTRRTTLKKHLLIHKNIKPFLCNLCLKSFTDQRTYDRHIDIHKENYSYECTLCTVKSLRKDNIFRHVRNMHPEENYKSTIQQINDNYNKLKNQICIDSCNDKKNVSVIVENKGNSIDVINNKNLEVLTSNQIITTSTTNINNIQCSVIKFAGKHNDNIEIVDNLNKCNSENQLSVILDSDDNFYKGVITSTANNTNNYNQSLILNKGNQNYNIYRQLLSPYLKSNETNKNEIVESDKLISNVAVEKSGIVEQESLINTNTSDTSDTNNTNITNNIKIETDNSNNSNTNDIYSNTNSNNIFNNINIDDGQQKQQYHQSSTQYIHPKKQYKRNNNHLEICRRILMPSQDDEYQIVNDNFVNQEKSDNNQMLPDNIKNNRNKTQTNAGNSNKDNFSEIHWRKRTSQSYVYTQLDY